MNHKLNHACRTFAFIALAGSTPAATADDNGWYVGAGLGEVDYASSGVLNLNGQAFAARELNDPDDPLSSSLSLAFGYRFNRYVSVEAGYLSNDVTTLALTDDAGNRFGTFEFRSQGASLAIVGTLPLGRWELDARAGVLYADTKIRIAPDAGLVMTAREHSPELLTALGAAYNFDEHWQGNLDFTYVPDAGERTGTGQSEVEVVTAGFTYRF